VNEASKQSGFIGAQRFVSLQSEDQPDSAKTCILATYWETAGSLQASASAPRFSEMLEEVRFPQFLQNRRCTRPTAWPYVAVILGTGRAVLPRWRGGSNETIPRRVFPASACTCVLSLVHGGISSCSNFPVGMCLPGRRYFCHAGGLRGRRTTDWMRHGRWFWCRRRLCDSVFAVGCISSGYVAIILL